MNTKVIRSDMLAAYPTVEALRTLAANLDAQVRGRGITSVIPWALRTDLVAHAIIQELAKHSWTEAQIRAAL